MRVNVQTPNFNATNNLLVYVEKRLKKLELFYDRIVFAEVFLKVQKMSKKQNKLVEILLSIPGEDLIVKNIIVDAAPTQKRIRFRSMGRVFRVLKRHCHVTVYIEGNVSDVPVTKGKTTAAKAEDAPIEVVETKAKSAKKKSAAKKTWN